MSDLEARIAEVLEEHDFDPSRLVSSIVACSCDQWAEDLPQGRGRYAAHRQHVTEMVAKVVREAQADLVDVLADLIDDTQNGHDIAECAAYTPGETGRQACIDAWEELIEEPAEWLRKKATEHRGHERDHVQELLFDAWQSGCEEAMDAAGYAPGPRNAMYDRNPYKEQR